MHRALLALVVLASGCGDRAPPEAQPANPPVRARPDVSDLITKYECNRCHDVPSIAAAPRAKHCVACHQAIHDGTFEADAVLLAGWRSRIKSLRWVPSLADADRLQRAWVRDFLLAPHDVRPGLLAQMPRLAMKRPDAERLAAFLVPDDPSGDPLASPAAAAPADVTRGEQLYRSLACGRCHRFTGAAVDDAALHAAGRDQPQPSSAWPLAPDLRHARVRVQPAKLATWIAKPRGAMPDLGIAAGDARALAAFIVTTPLAAQRARTPPSRLPRLTRAVTWDEVEARVFKNTCWHCHAVPDFARGDGGPGNSGGFGFAPRGLDVSSYTGISSGSLDDAGEPRSIFAPLPDGTPRVVGHLLARHAEEAGHAVDGVRGMPLGLPPLPIEEIQLVDSWIAQGRPR